MSLIRHRQRAQTAILPHSKNRRILVPSRGPNWGDTDPGIILPRPTDLVGVDGLSSNWPGQVLTTPIDFANETWFPTNGTLKVLWGFLSFGGTTGMAGAETAPAIQSFYAPGNNTMRWHAETAFFSGQNWTQQRNEAQMVADITATQMSAITYTINGDTASQPNQTPRAENVWTTLGVRRDDNTGGTTLLYHFQIEARNADDEVTFIQRWFMDEGSGNTVNSHPGDTINNPLNIGGTEGVNWQWVS